jgi:hypothetical protein
MSVGLTRGEVVDMTPIVRDLPVRQVTFEQYVRRIVARVPDESATP